MTEKGATAQQKVLIDACYAFGVSFHWMGPGTLLIQKADLGWIVPEIIKGGSVILGFEGFELDGSDLHPRLDLIVDLERTGTVSEPFSTISGWPEDIWVDVALREPASSVRLTPEPPTA